MDKTGKIVAQETTDQTKITPSLQDMERIQNIIDLNAHDSWSYPFIDKETNTHLKFEKDIRAQIAPFNDVPIVFTSVTEKQRIYNKFSR